jgi:hypothetical protein
MTGTGTQNDPFVISSWTDFITAVGTSDAYVEFPKSLVRTSDSAVDPNKLYIDSSGTVQTNVQPSDLANLYENTFKLDANDYAPAGLSATIEINCASINGYGATIINLASSAVNLITNNSSALSISQLAVLNINAENVYFIYETYPIDYYKCIFSGRMTNNTSTLTKMFGSTGHHHSTFISCAKNVVVDGYVDIYNVGWQEDGAELEYCRVELHIKSNSNYAGHLYISAKNSYFTGDCLKSWSTYFSADSVYSVVEIACESGTMSLDIFNNAPTLILVNSDVFKGYFSRSYYTEVNTATLTDASALDALGFPIQT